MTLLLIYKQSFIATITKFHEVPTLAQGIAAMIKSSYKLASIFAKSGLPCS